MAQWNGTCWCGTGNSIKSHVGSISPVVKAVTYAGSVTASSDGRRTFGGTAEPADAPVACDGRGDRDVVPSRRISYDPPVRRPTPAHVRRLFPAFTLAFLASTLTVGPASAQVGVRPADQWIAMLDSAERIEGMKVPELMARLEIRKEMVVADVGAGSGVLTGPLALATGPRGLVYASDIDKALLAHIDQRAQSSRLANIRTVLGTFTDPMLPQQVDLALMNDVLHHVQDRAAYVKNVARHLKRGGRFAIVDYTADGSPHKGEPALVVSEQQVNEWAAAAGLARTQSYALYSDRYFVIYTKK